MKKIALFLTICLLSTFSMQAQKYMTRNGHVWFFSHTPVEDIEAHNYQVTSVLDAAKGEMVFQALMKGFQFEKALMQEHFNEKYVNSDKFPKTTFKGKITNLDQVDFGKDGTYEVTVKGELTIHGVTKPVETTGTITIDNAIISAAASFPITVADHDIRIPALVEENISKIVQAHVEMKYELLQN